MKQILLFLIVTLPILGLSQQITGVNPNEAEQGETLQVTITGSNTGFTQGSTTVWFSQGSSVISSFIVSVTNDEALETQVNFDPNAPLGFYDVNVENTYNGTMTLEDGFTLNPDAAGLTSITPNVAEQDEPLTFTVTGHNTHFTQASSTAAVFTQGNSTVYINEMNVVNDETLQFPNHAFSADDPAGTYDLEAYNEMDGFMVLQDAVEVIYNQPSIVNVTPGQVEQNEEITLSITGNNTHFTQATNTTISFSNGTSVITVNNASAINDEEIYISSFTVDETYETGYYDLSISNELDGDLQLNNALQVLMPSTDPAINQVIPGEVYQNTNSPLTIAGEYTNFTSGGVTINFSNSDTTFQIIDFSVSDDETIQISDYYFGDNIPVGVYTLNVHNNADGNLSKDHALTVSPDPNAPGLLSVSPNDIHQNESTIITITGSNTSFEDANSISVFFVQNDVDITVTDVSVVDNETIQLLDYVFNTNTPTGIYDVYVDNNIDGLLGLPGSLNIKPPYNYNQGLNAKKPIHIYPSPTSGKFTIHTEDVHGKTQLLISNSNGVVVKKDQLNLSTSNYRMIDISSFPAGLYFITLKAENGTCHSKLVLTR